jgi:hypothetical protein
MGVSIPTALVLHFLLMVDNILIDGPFIRRKRSRGCAHHYQ